MLWPAWSWRVLAADHVHRKLDPFLRVVAMLCQAGLTDPAEQAEVSGLHMGMCQNIMQMLRQRHLIDHHRRLTVQGLRALDGQAWDASTQRLLFVFQSPFTGPGSAWLWPAARPSLDYAHVDYLDDGRPRLRLDARRDATPIHPMIVSTVGVRPPARPRSEAIAAAIRTAATRVSGEETQTAAAPPVGTQAGRVSYVGGQPEPVFLLTCAYLPEGAYTSADWEALDPFTGWPHAELKQLILERAEEDTRLAATIGRIRSRLVNQDAAAQQQEQRRLAQAEVRAQDRLGRRLLDPEYADVLKLLTHIEADHAQAVALGSLGGRRRQSAVNNALKLFEEIFFRLARRFPLNSARLHQLRDGRDGTRMLEHNLRRVRAHTGVAAVPEGVRRQQHDQVARAAAGTLPSFRAGLAGVLIATLDHPRHPLLGALHRRPTLCDQLDRAAKLRNDASHRGDHEPSPEETAEIVELLYWTTEHLLMAPTIPAKEDDGSATPPLRSTSAELPRGRALAGSPEGGS
ncbi:hypothetical protein Cme02nite_55770 [Catellatospora methionotrophica]|uniref:Uncharacterized protein n=2 Tax=Catellatospora methionotrophica TaxID=121620 RepID=A0A8J3LMF9_9ACTN|nr:hypothetical protein Cme02nite_55770 [Catellatospora methionotrophica]